VGDNGHHVFASSSKIGTHGHRLARRVGDDNGDR
jgi:hypothetical protein